MKYEQTKKKAKRQINRYSSTKGKTPIRRTSNKNKNVDQQPPKVYNGWVYQKSDDALLFWDHDTQKWVGRSSASVYSRNAKFQCINKRRLNGGNFIPAGQVRPLHDPDKEKWINKIPKPKFNAVIKEPLADVSDDIEECQSMSKQWTIQSRMRMLPGLGTTEISKETIEAHYTDWPIDETIKTYSRSRTLLQELKQQNPDRVFRAKKIMVPEVVSS